jgi:putative oxidoreductase
MSHRIEKTLDGWHSVAFTLLRLAVGVIFVVHGAMKLSDVTGTAQAFAAQGIPLAGVSVYLAIAGEFLGGLGVLIGLLTRVAALGNFCVMVVAIGFVHLGHGLLGKNGGWEYPLVLLLTSLLFITSGAGPFSVDALIRKLRQRPARHGSEAAHPV